MKYYITNITQSSPTHPRLQPYTLYADLRRAGNGSLAISATLAYICEAVVARRYELVPDPANL